jgi:hypothetical protein
MARMPGADWLGEHSPGTPMTRWDVVCVHTIFGYAPAHAAHFSVKADGTIQQSRDTAFRSAANLNGNHRVIAIENEDHGPAFGNWSGSDVPPLTDAQVIANGRILAWAHREHGIPLKMCPNSRPTAKGLGYHRLGIDGNFGGYRFGGRVSGGEVWTSSYGKVCPGDNRIAQLPLILRTAQQIVRGGPVSESEEDDMTPRELLDEPINIHDPRGQKETRRVTVGELLTGLGILLQNSTDPAVRDFMDKAQKSKA